MNATTYTKDYDGNRNPYTKARIVRVNFIGDDGKMSVPIELLRALVADLDEEGRDEARSILETVCFHLRRNDHVTPPTGRDCTNQIIDRIERFLQPNNSL